MSAVSESLEQAARLELEGQLEELRVEMERAYEKAGGAIQHPSVLELSARLDILIVRWYKERTRVHVYTDKPFCREPRR